MEKYGQNLLKKRKIWLKYDVCTPLIAREALNAWILSHKLLIKIKFKRLH